MRSSIACVRCRRSKVKCVNSGINTTCRACESSGRECTYPNPQQGSSAAAALAAGAGGEIKRPRPKKPAQSVAGNLGGSGSSSGHHHPGARKESPRVRRGYTIDDALDPKLLTSSVWKSLFESFCQHFYPTFPFIHTPSFLKSPQASLSSTIPSGSLPHSPYVLLGMLTLTARFSEELVAALTPPHGHPPGVQPGIAASEYYASCLRYLLFQPANQTPSAGTAGVEFGEPSVDKIQALLMLALHEWGGMKRGAQAWTWVGVAMRMAEVLGLGVETSEGDFGDFYKAVNNTVSAASLSTTSPTIASASLSTPLKREWEGEQQPPSKRRRTEFEKAGKEAFVEEEARRRTFWAAFMMERALAGVHGRRSRIRLEDINGREVHEDGVLIRLPVSDNHFFFRNRTSTGVLSLDAELGIDSNEDADVETEGEVARLLRISEIWGRVQRWAVTPSLRVRPPTQLSALAENFLAALPEEMQLTEDNLSAHAMHRTAPHFISIHLTAFLSLIYLHRPSLPFLPLPASSQPPPQTASLVFKAARDILDLIGHLDSPLENPLGGFACYSALLLYIYARAFPWIDVDNHLSAPAPIPGAHDEDVPMMDQPPAAAGGSYGIDDDALRRNLYQIKTMPKSWEIMAPFPPLLLDAYETFTEALQGANIQPTKGFTQQLGGVLRAFIGREERSHTSQQPAPVQPREEKREEKASETVQGWAAINSSSSAARIESPETSRSVKEEEGITAPSGLPALDKPTASPSPQPAPHHQPLAPAQTTPAATPSLPHASLQPQQTPHQLPQQQQPPQQPYPHPSASPAPPTPAQLQTERENQSPEKSRIERVASLRFAAEDLELFLKGGDEGGRGWVGEVGRK